MKPLGKIKQGIWTGNKPREIMLKLSRNRERNTVE
jgi:hypothetical protein